ncbi:MAG: hypothetical protein MJ082_02485 [Clostridia bacterium]|nr:hypothetical protein [Clostridia bacterium]
MNTASERTHRRFLHRNVLSFLALILAVTLLSSCFDLGPYDDGDGEKYSAYYQSFGEVKAYYGLTKNTYSVEKSLFTESSVNHFEWDTENGEVAVDSKPYFYIAIPILEDENVDSIALFLNASAIHYPSSVITPPSGAEVKINVFLLESDSLIPVHARKRGDPEYEEIPDDSAPGGIRLEPISYDDPDPESAFATANLFLTENTWDSFTVDTFRIGEGQSSLLSVHAGNVILLRIENNAGYTDEESSASLEFTFINLLVRRVE